jgi:hypothetical protein
MVWDMLSVALLRPPSRALCKPVWPPVVTTLGEPLVSQYMKVPVSKPPLRTSSVQ